MSPSPLVSVIVPTFNRSAYLRPAIDSVLGQTLTDLELVVVDDGSSDDTAELLEGIADSRLRVVRHPANRGIAEARNSGLDAAAGKYIAWLDSDDVCRPDRLAVQVRYLEAHPGIALVGGCAGKIRGDGRRRRGLRVPPFDPDDVRCWLLFKSAFQQSSVMGGAAILKGTPYDASFRVCEDIDVFVRLAASHRLANLPRALVERRMHEGQVSRERREEVCAAQARISAPQLTQMGVSFDDQDLLRHAALARVPRSALPREFLDWADEWLERLAQANRRTGYVNPRALEFLSGLIRFKTRLHASTSLVPALRSPVQRGVLSGHSLAWVGRAAPVLIREAIP